MKGVGLTSGLILLFSMAGPAAACRYAQNVMTREQARTIVDEAKVVFEGVVVSISSTTRATVRATTGIKGIAVGSVVEVDGGAGSCSVVVQVGETLRVVSPDPTPPFALHEAGQYWSGQIWNFPDIIEAARAGKK